MLRKETTLYRAQYLCTQRPGVWREDTDGEESPHVREAIGRALQIRALRNTKTRVVDDADNVIMQYGLPIAA